jgi:hypothetical protein
MTDELEGRGHVQWFTPNFMGEPGLAVRREGSQGQQKDRSKSLHFQALSIEL